MHFFTRQLAQISSCASPCHRHSRSHSHIRSLRTTSSPVKSNQMALLDAASAPPAVDAAAPQWSSAARLTGNGVSRPQILFIEGMGVKDSEWYTDGLLGMAYVEQPAHPGVSARWAAFDVRRVSADQSGDGPFSGGPEVVREIASGCYGCVVVSDLSSDTAMAWFERVVGPTIQTFVDDGGMVIFPTAAGLQLCPVLRRLFDTPWTPSGCCRTTWGARSANAELIAIYFPGFAPNRRYQA